MIQHLIKAQKPGELSLFVNEKVLPDYSITYELVKAKSKALKVNDTQAENILPKVRKQFPEYEFSLT